MRKIVFLFLILLIFPSSSFSAISCEQHFFGFVVKDKQRDSSKLKFVCTGTTGKVAISDTNFNHIKGKKLLSVRAFPTFPDSVTNAAVVEIQNSRGYDIFRKGTNLIPTSGEVESHAYNPTDDLYWYPPFDDENGYSIEVKNLEGESSFTIEISIQENNIL